MTEEEIEANAASDPDNPPWTEEDFRNARLVQPGSAGKPVIWVHVDEDVRQWVHERAGDTDQMINDLLRTAMEKERTERRSLICTWARACEVQHGPPAAVHAPSSWQSAVDSPRH